MPLADEREGLAVTTAHGLCIGPEHALNVHRDCPGSAVGCGCACHRDESEND